MTSARLATIFAAALAVLLLALTPLSLALSLMAADARGLSARVIEGAIWRGRLTDATFAGAPLGDARVGLDLPGLVLGGGRIWFATDGPVSARGVARLSPTRFDLIGVDARLASEGIVRGLPIHGRVRMDDVSVGFRRGACERASGRISVAEIRIQGLAAPLPGLSLTGVPRCERDRLVLPLSGQVEGVSAEAILRVDAAGRYELETSLRSSNPGMLALSGLRGFERTLEGVRRVDRGRLGHAPI